MSEKNTFNPEATLAKPAVPVKGFGEARLLSEKQEEYRRLLADYRVAYGHSPWDGLENKAKDENEFDELLETIKTGSAAEVLNLTAGEARLSKVGQGAQAKVQKETQKKIMALRDELRAEFKATGAPKETYRGYIKQRQANQADLFFYNHLSEIIRHFSEMAEQTRSKSLKAGRKRLTPVEENLRKKYETIISASEGKQRELQARNPELDLGLRLQELVEYAKEAKAGFVKTPAVREHIEYVKDAWEREKMVLLTGPTGGGKTEILVEAAKEMDKDFPELIAGTDQTGLTEIFGSVGLEEGEKGGTKTKHEPGPFTRALQSGKKLVFDEINLVSNKINMALKAAANRKPGEPVDIPRNGKVMRADGYAMGATMNVKSEKHKDRFELDPAVARIFRAQRKIGYLPKEEMYDVCLATFIDPKEGTANISLKDAEGILKNFVEAVVDVQKAYEGESEFIEPGKAAQKKKSSLDVAVIDIGAALTMLKAADFSDPQAKVKLGIELARFAGRENYPAKDRALLAKIFAKWKMLDGVPWKELEPAGLSQADLNSLGWKKEASQAESFTEMTPLQVATIDPFSARKKRKAAEDENEFGKGKARGKGEDGGKLEDAKDFEYNETEARRLGLERLELADYPQADLLIKEFTDKIKPLLAELNITKDEDKKKELNEELEAEKTAFESAWRKDCPDLPAPLRTDKSKWWYLTQLAEGRIISSLTDDSKTVSPNFGCQEVILADSWQEEDWDDKVPGSEDKKLQTIISPLLQEFLGQGIKGVVNIKREDLDAALWEDDPGERIPSETHRAVLAKLGLDPDKFEFRCIRQDEYARGSASKGWGQRNLWTNFDHYFLGGDGERGGLSGGSRGYGGAGDVGYYWRGDAHELLAVRLVLSRKQTG